MDGTNYDDWKAKIVAFLKSINNKTWKVVIKGWKYPVNVSQYCRSSLNPKDEWTNAKDNDDLGKSKVLNAIFNGVDKNMFILINTCTKAK